eukprot:2493659-Prymnesium_polylepis.1
MTINDNVPAADNAHGRDDRSTTSDDMGTCPNAHAHRPPTNLSDSISSLTSCALIPTSLPHPSSPKI